MDVPDHDVQLTRDCWMH